MRRRATAPPPVASLRELAEQERAAEPEMPDDQLELF